MEEVEGEGETQVERTETEPGEVGSKQEVVGCVQGGGSRQSRNRVLVATEPLIS